MFREAKYVGYDTVLDYIFMAVALIYSIITIYNSCKDIKRIRDNK